MSSNSLFQDALPPLKQERSRKTRQRILETAAELFLDQGYDQVSTNGVAAAAGISIGSLYRYFPDKQAVLAALVAAESADLRQAMRRILATTGPLPTLDRILDQLIDPLTLPRERPRLCLRMLQGAAASPELAMITRQLDSEMVDFVSRLLQLLYPEMPPESARLRGRACVTIVDALAAVINQADTPSESLALIAELKRLLYGWFSAMGAPMRDRIAETALTTRLHP